MNVLIVTRKGVIQKVIASESTGALRALVDSWESSSVRWQSFGPRTSGAHSPTDGEKTYHMHLASVI